VIPLTYTAGQQVNMNIGVDDLSVTPTFTPPALAPDAPSGLVLNVLNSSKIQLTWTDNSLIESGFKIERSPDGLAPWTPVFTTGANATTFTNTGLTQSTLYHYRVIATNVAGDSAPSASASDTTLANSPGSVRFVASAASVVENLAAGTVTLSVERIGDSDGAVSVDFGSIDGTALAGLDYTSATGTLNWADGDESVKTFTVPIINDSLVEPDETFTVNLSAATGGVVIASPDIATVTITNDDFNGSIKFSATTYPAAETAGTVTLTAQRTAGSAGAVSIDYITSNGTALAGSHYTTATGTLNWADGDVANKTFTVTLADDAVTNRSRSFTATLSNPGGGATLGTPVAATVTIADNETGFALFDNFSSGTVGQSAPGWLQNAANTDTQMWTRVDPADALNQVGGIKRNSGTNVRSYYLPLGVDAIANGSNGTLFMRFRLAAGVNGDRFNLGLGLADVTTPNGNFTDFEPLALVANTADTATPNLQARNAGTTTTLTTVTKSIWYNIWFVANNTTDTYDVHLNTGTGGATVANRIATGFVFRNGVAANSLRHILLVLGSPSVNNPEVFVDDVYLDRTAANLANPLNTAPTITGPGNQSIDVNTATSALALTVGDTETAVGSLTLTGASSNQTLVPDANIVFGGSGANRTVTVTPAASQTGTATITVTVSDGSLTAQSTFDVTVNPVVVLTPAEQWRQTYFGSPANSGDGADGNDFDKDGLVNLLERAFKTIPNDASSSYLPTQSVVSDTGINYLAITYRQLTGGTGTNGVDYTMDGMKYTVEYDADLIAPWSQSGITVVSVSAPVSGVETVTVRLNTAMSAASTQFIRLAVVSTP
jgi:hypothetical protein